MSVLISTADQKPRAVCSALKKVPVVPWTIQVAAIPMIWVPSVTLLCDVFLKDFRVVCLLFFDDRISDLIHGSNKSENQFVAGGLWSDGVGCDACCYPFGVLCRGCG